MPLVIVIGLVVPPLFKQELPPSDKIRVLVAPFERPDQTEPLFTSRILEALQESVGDDIIVERLQEHISVEEGAAAAPVWPACLQTDPVRWPERRPH